MAQNACISACNTCTRVFLVLINILIGILGILLLASGVFIKVSVDIILGSVSNLANSAGVGNVIGDINLQQITGPLDSAAIGLIVIGIFLFIVSILGCISGCTSNKCILITYAILTGLICIVLIVGTVLLFAGPLTNKVRNDLEDLLKNRYVGALALFNVSGFAPVNANDDTAASAILDVIQWQYKCCGLNSSMDFNAATKWNKNIMINGAAVTLPFPISCCKAFDFNQANIDSTKIEACVKTPTESNSYQNRGCWKEIEDLFNMYKNPAVIAMSVIIVIMFLLTLMAIYICCTKKSDKQTSQWADDAPKRKGAPRDPYYPEYYAKANPYGPQPRRNTEDTRYNGGGYDSRFDSYGRGGPRTVNSRMYTPDWYSNDRAYVPRVMGAGTFSNAGARYGAGWR